ncbi:MAG: mechanosensitive ion channel domain-containing protein, partial [Bacteroidota bacterium]
FIAILVAIQNLSIDLTVIWASITALLVGLGLGLQTTFNDWVSGIILLFEGSVEVGDIIQMDDKTIGTVRKIGVRTSRVETLENVTIIVPNSQLTNDKVINWSHYDNKIRFVVKVGVAYGSDTKLVKGLLLEAARENEFVMTYPSPFVRFVNFGDSSLDFELHIWSQDFLHIEDVKSDLRFSIDQRFRANDVAIPFPQMDIWVKNG